MKKLLIKFFTLIIITATLSRAQLHDPFAIAMFNINPPDTATSLESSLIAQRFETSNFFIASQKTITGTDTLVALSSPPTFIQPGQVVMRKKYGGDYRLYLGDLNDSAFHASPRVYAFPIPSWSRSGQIMWYRIYSEPTNNRNLDLETVYFDNERIYLQRHTKIYFSRNDVWDSIAGVPANPFGSLHVDSEPQGADIHIYGVSTGKQTPAVFDGLIAGRYEVELFLPEYRFQRWSVHVRKGETAHSSFQLVSGLDTLRVLGEEQHGILVLPYPPQGTAYVIDDAIVTDTRLRLLAGDYKLTFRGNGMYKDIDTSLSITAGQALYFNAPFERLSGTAIFELHPQDARICVEGFPCRVGDFEMELPSGFHNARVSRFGFEPQRRPFVISHGKKYRISIVLEENADRDYDGFPDSIDRCPDVYGLFDGCPHPTFWHRLSMRYIELNEYMENEPFSFSVSLAGYVHRSPHDKRFNEVITSFSGGPRGGLNNYSGLTLGNIYQVSSRGFMATLELGQSSAGVKYRRSDTLKINTRHDRYEIFYDTLAGVEPAIFLPSTAASIGFKYRLLNYSVGYSLGHQWEDIIVEQVRRTSDGGFVRAVFDNDHWFHELLFEADIFMDLIATPSIYMKFKFPFGPIMRTHWNTFHAGLQLRLRPINRNNEENKKWYR